MSPKTEQLQIRVSRAQKAAIRRLARRAGRTVSSYVLARVLPEGRMRFGGILHALREDEEPRFALADLNDFLSGLLPHEIADSVGDADLEGLTPHLRNTVAAMVEHAAWRMDVDPPSWAADVEPLGEPHFAVPFPSLRPYLLRVSPVAFKRRNLFVDSTVGDRV